MAKPIKYSEIFHSFQGEGKFTGRSTAWIRYFLCNLQCDGFGQKDPTDPSTYVLPYETFDVSSVKRVEDLPVWEYGCDSSYTWSKKYKHLMTDGTPEGICNEIQRVLTSPSNPIGKFLHPKTLQWHHMAFTGGEPMLKPSQLATVSILKEFQKRGNFPAYVTVETNGTTELTQELFNMLSEIKEDIGSDWFWSCSPKLFHTSGEHPDKAINPDVLAGYAEAFDHGQLKYVVNGTDESWDDVEKATADFHSAGVYWPVYIMPVGATKEEQEEPQIAEIAVEAMKRGYNVAARVHCYVFGNQIGT